MPRVIRKCPSFSNVQAGSTATCELPLGLSYEGLHLYFGGVTLAQMKNIRIEADGKAIKKWADGERLNAENKHFQRGLATADCLPIFFSRKELNELEQQRMFSIGTNDVQTLSLLVDIHEDAAAPTLKATSIRSNQSPMGYITRIMEFKHSSAVSGEIEIDNIPIRAGASIAAIHIYSPDVTEASLEINDRVVWEMSKTGAAKLQTDYGREPQSADKMTLDFILEGDILQAVQLQDVRDFRLKPVLANAGSMDIVVEYLESYNPAA